MLPRIIKASGSGQQMRMTCPYDLALHITTTSFVHQYSIYVQRLLTGSKVWQRLVLGDLVSGASARYILVYFLDDSPPSNRFVNGGSHPTRTSLVEDHARPSITLASEASIACIIYGTITSLQLRRWAREVAWCMCTTWKKFR